MADRRPLPDPLLLRAVDVILEDRQFGRAQATEWNAPRLRLAGDA
jgi:hypothetical protein